MLFGKRIIRIESYNDSTHNCVGLICLWKAPHVCFEGFLIIISDLIATLAAPRRLMKANQFSIRDVSHIMPSPRRCPRLSALWDLGCHTQTGVNRHKNLVVGKALCGSLQFTKLENPQKVLYTKMARRRGCLSVGNQYLDILKVISINNTSDEFIN